MYVCYVDESGHNGKKYNPDQPVEVLCGVLTDVTKLFKTQRELKVILRFLRKKGIPLSELKAADAYRGRKNWSSVDPKLRDKIFELVVRWAEARSCKFIVCPVDTKKYFDLLASGCALTEAIGFPYEAGALNIILSVQRLHSGKKKNKGKTFIVFDEQHDHDENITKLLPKAEIEREIGQLHSKHNINNDTTIQIDRLCTDADNIYRSILTAETSGE